MSFVKGKRGWWEMGDGRWEMEREAMSEDDGLGRREIGVFSWLRIK